MNTLSEITNPSKPDTVGIRKVSGFTKGTTASSAIIYDTADRNSTSTTTYDFTGWYKEAAAENQVATNSTTPRLLANTAYTDSAARWNYTDKDNLVTLYAGWEKHPGGYNSITLPTISMAGHTCGWAETENATEIEYASGHSFVPQGNLTLYGVCIANTYRQTVQVRYQNAAGTWGSYATYNACTTDKVYGSTHSCSIPATTEYQAANLSYTVTGNETKQIDVYRKSYTITITNTNVTTNKTSFNVLYGGSSTVTVTPNSGYGLVSVSCPAGFACTGYSLGAAHTEQQTIIVTYNNANAGGTMSLVGNTCDPITGTMQSFSPTTKSCANGTLTDTRDSSTYTIAKIGSTWWMTQNLRFKGTNLDPSTTNIDVAKTITYGDLTAGDTYDEARIHDSGNTTNGVWYNYAAASAMTITGSNNTTYATYSLCPKGWRLPNYAEMDSVKNQVVAFKPVGGGRYNGGTTRYSWGEWWSATANYSTVRYYMYGSSTDAKLSLDGYDAGKRSFGRSVRCVKS